MMLVDAFMGEACLIYEGSWALQVCRSSARDLAACGEMIWFCVA